MREIIIRATDNAIHAVNASRFFQTERGFQGRFYCALQAELDSAGLLVNGAILEMEYQKGSAHGIGQRPDIILHIPVEHSGADRRANNYAVWALKRRATPASAHDNFNKLNQMFDVLDYPLGFFVNIDTTNHMAENYVGDYRNRLEAVAASFDDGRITATWAAART